MSDKAYSLNEQFLTTLQGKSAEDVKRLLTERHNTVLSTIRTLKEGILQTQTDTERARQRLDGENLHDIERSIGLLSPPLVENMKTLRMNESSLAGNTAVLEYDNANCRASKLRKLVSARKQLESSLEALKETSREDPAAVFSTLQDLKTSIDTIKQCVPDANINVREVEDAKDAFLAWQSTALVLAIEQSVMDKVNEIYNIYSTLDRRDEFVRVCIQACSNRFNSLQLDTSSVEKMLTGMFFELERHIAFFFRDKNVLSLEESTTAFEKIMSTGLPHSFVAGVQEILSSEATPINFLIDLDKKLAGLDSTAKKLTAPESTMEAFRRNVLHAVSKPLSSSISSHFLAVVNKINVANGSFKERLESLDTTGHDLLVKLDDVMKVVLKIFPPNDAYDVLRKPFDVCIDNFTARVKPWQYHVKGEKESETTRSINDLGKLIECSGALCMSFARLKSIAEQSFSDEKQCLVNDKPINRWCSGIVDKTMNLAVNSVCSGVEQSVGKMLSVPSTVDADMPAFSLTPSEYITTVSQDLLHIFNVFNTFVASPNKVYAFGVWTKRGDEGEYTFRCLMNEMATQISKSLSKVIGDVSAISRPHCKQLITDTQYFLDVLLDMSFSWGSEALLNELLEKLKKRTEKSTE